MATHSLNAVRDAIVHSRWIWDGKQNSADAIVDTIWSTMWQLPKESADHPQG